MSYDTASVLDKDRPNFLTSRWLKTINVGLLRKELLHFMYHLYLEQLPDEHPAFDVLFQELSAYDASGEPKSGHSFDSHSFSIRYL